VKLPKFLQLKPILYASSSPAAAGGPLDFHIQPQVPNNWCWAATSSSVSCYYNPQSSWTQCEIANKQLHRTDCCPAVKKGPCDKIGYLEKALTTTGNLAKQAGRVMFSEIQNEIDGKRPLGCRIDWGTSSGHFVVIYGYALTADKTKYVDIGDPLHSDSQIHIKLSSFTNSYQGQGRWTDSYYTKA
jgi:hypothetical protein